MKTGPAHGDAQEALFHVGPAAPLRSLEAGNPPQDTENRLPGPQASWRTKTRASPCPQPVRVLASPALRNLRVIALLLLSSGALRAQESTGAPLPEKVEAAEIRREHLAAAERAAATFLSFQVQRAGLAADELITYRGFYLSADGLAAAPLQAFDSGHFTARNESDGSPVKVEGAIAVEADHGFAIIRTDQRQRTFLTLSRERTEIGTLMAIPRARKNGGSVLAPVLARRKAPLPRAQKYIEVLSIGVNFGRNGALHVPAGTPLLDEQGEVSGCLYQPFLNSNQLFFFAAPAPALALKSPVHAEKAALIPFPLPAAFRPADPLTLDASYLLGRDAQIRGDVVQAERLLRQALARHPQSALGWQRLGLVLRARNRGEDAMKAFQKASEYGNHLGTFLLNQADQLSLMGRIGEATTLLKKACETNPQDYDLHRAYAVALRSAKDEEAAQKHLEIATKIAPDSLRCWSLLSKCLAGQAKWDQEKKASDNIYRLESLYRPR